MYVVTVLFAVKPECAALFRAAILEQARISLDEEPGCRQFDICLPAEAPDEIFLYEVYRTQKDFERHLASDHFKTFDAKVTPWVEGKHVRCFEKIGP
ncbi:MAG: antibiotic biosynthesis monooxygenase [Rhodobiaceae bacterium]|nr:antibiotic biosynthesis monooxygenase [Rhodobiaceae bacterium]MCC0049756.1 antibiotic biosynthesis monooxygenase [Rhodobiaceae bacterium]